MPFNNKSIKSLGQQVWVIFALFTTYTPYIDKSYYIRVLT